MSQRPSPCQATGRGAVQTSLKSSRSTPPLASAAALAEVVIAEDRNGGRLVDLHHGHGLGDGLGGLEELGVFEHLVEFLFLCYFFIDHKKYIKFRQQQQQNLKI